MTQQRVIIDGRYISDLYPGIGRYAFNLVAALAEVSQQLAITLLVGKKEPQTRFDLQRLQARGVELLEMRSPLQSLRGYLEGRRAGRGGALFHAPHILSAIPAALPSVVTIQDVIPIQMPAELPSARRRFVYRVLLRRALTVATRLLTPSRAVGDVLQDRWGVSGHRISVTPYAADPSFRPLPRQRVASRRDRLRLPERYVLYVGTRRPHKNLPRLLEAWASLHADRRNGCSLVIAGPSGTGYAETLRGAGSPRNDGVILLGAVGEADMPVLYGGARLTVHPALSEGFGLTVIEAMACGAPVACSNARALDEACGDAALRFDAGSVGDVAGAIDKALNDDRLRNRLVTAGLARAQELSWIRTAELTLSAYRKALATASSRDNSV